MTDQRQESFVDFVDGAFMEFGVTAIDDGDARSRVEAWIANSDQFKDLQYRIEFDYLGVIDREDLQSEVYSDDEVVESLLSDPAEIGLWYRTGVAWYTDD